MIKELYPMSERDCMKNKLESVSFLLFENLVKGLKVCLLVTQFSF